jgi:hypothetical protein
MKEWSGSFTVSVHVEDRTAWNGSLQIFDLVIRGDESMDKEGDANDGKVEGEK